MFPCWGINFPIKKGKGRLFDPFSCCKKTLNKQCPFWRKQLHFVLLITLCICIQNGLNFSPFFQICFFAQTYLAYTANNYNVKQSLTEKKGSLQSPIISSSFFAQTFNELSDMLIETFFCAKKVNHTFCSFLHKMSLTGG